MRVLNRAQMQACDRAAIDRFGIPELVLMENAGVQVVEALDEFSGGEAPELVAVLCGKGNNGGDGLVAARHLFDLGRAVRVYLFAEAGGLTGSIADNHRMAAALGVDIVEVPDAGSWRARAGELAGFDCVIDALFGTGIDGALRGHYGEVVEDINSSGATVVSVDIPSGLTADSGELYGPAVDADLTVTLAAPKWCHAFPPACELCGELAVVDIGIPQSCLEAIDDALELITLSECETLLPPRDPDTHKGTYGHVLLIAGAPGTAGAAVLAARGALRGGAGLVTVATPETAYPAVAAQLTEALVRSFPSSAGGGFGSAAEAGLLELAGSVDVVALGPGIGGGAETVALIRRLAGAVGKPLVIDADGLNAFVGGLDELAAVTAPLILTPHPGEAARLLEQSAADVQADRVSAANALARSSGATVVLKGYRSLICTPEGRLAVNPTGNAGMATGGAGDVLTGLVAALVGQGADAIEAARVGTFLHGEAGDLAAEQVGEIPLIATDIVAALPAALARLSPER